jgi:hypothetical protein
MSEPARDKPALEFPNPENGAVSSSTRQNPHQIRTLRAKLTGGVVVGIEKKERANVVAESPRRIDVFTQLVVNQAVARSSDRRMHLRVLAEFTRDSSNQYRHGFYLAVSFDDTSDFWDHLRGERR